VSPRAVNRIAVRSIVALLMLCGAPVAARSPHYTGEVVPRPQQILSAWRFLPITPESLEVQIPSPAHGAIELARNMLRERAHAAATEATGSPGAVGKIVIVLGSFDDEIIQQADRRFELRLRQVVLPPEGYAIRVREEAGATFIVAAGQSPRGAFYAAMTLWQNIGVEGGRPGARCAEINDWPEWQRRFVSDYGPAARDSLQMLTTYKINGYAIQHRAEWRDFAPDRRPPYGGRFGTYQAALDEFKRWHDETGLVDGMLLLHIYAAAPRTQPWIDITSEADIAELVTRCRFAASHGIGHVMICVDDWTPAENGRYVCPHPQERQRFGDSVGRAHGYLMLRLHQALKPEFPELELSIVPAVYSLAHAAGKPENSRYLRDLAAEAPREVYIVWTGPQICSRSITREDFLAFARLVNHHRLLLWDNSNGFGRPLPSQPAHYYEGFAADSGGLVYYNLQMLGVDWQQPFGLCAGDYLWNPRAFDARASYAAVVQKLYGPEAHAPVAAYIERNRRLQAAPGDVRTQRRVVAEMERILKEMDRLGLPTRRLRAGLDSRRALLEAKPPSLWVARLAARPAIDGMLDDSCWKAATRFILRGTDEATESTEGLLGWDDANLYLGFTINHRAALTHPPGRVPRDRPIFFNSDDVIELFLQPEGASTYGHLVFDHQGNRFDEKGAGGGSSWNPGWRVEVARADGVWTAEVAVPFSAFAALGASAPRRGAIWKANFCRHLVAGGRLSAWSSVPGNPGFHTTELFGMLRFE
jgi:hyaluronoglucosaminidase